MKAGVAAVVGVAALAALHPALHAQQAAPPAPAPPDVSAPPVRSVWDGAYTEEQSKRGEALYRQECSICHGAALTGGEEAGPLAGATFTSNWNGVTLGDMLERIRISMPPTRPGRLSRQQIADVLAYVLSFNKFPRGKSELPRETERLKLIRFEATRP